MKHLPRYLLDVSREVNEGASRVTAPSALLHGRPVVFPTPANVSVCDVPVVFAEPREEKIRAVRERQAEERLRRLEELKKQALEAQLIREQKEAERRKRMDELRVKENERRSQVWTFFGVFL